MDESKGVDDGETLLPFAKRSPGSSFGVIPVAVRGYGPDLGTWVIGTTRSVASGSEANPRIGGGGLCGIGEAPAPVLPVPHWARLHWEQRIPPLRTTNAILNTQESRFSS